MLFAQGDAFFQGVAHFVFQLQVVFQHAFHVRTDVQRFRHHVRRAAQHEDALDHQRRVFGFVLHFVVIGFKEFAVTPFVVHARVDEVLVAGGEFACGKFVQVSDDFGIALHGFFSS